MRILYLSPGITVPGSHGGSTHTIEVARGLAARGHELHVVAAHRPGLRGLGSILHMKGTSVDGVPVSYLDLPKALSLLGFWQVGRLVRGLRPDVVMERYYNFAGAGIYWAHRLGIPSVLEVNALIVDPPQVLKRRLDDLLGGPLRRWATRQCLWSALIVTPLHTTVPPQVPRDKVVEIPWGANTAMFRPEIRQEQAAQVAALRGRLQLPADARVAVFAGSFRDWHGVRELVEAGAALARQRPDAYLLLVGGGPLQAEVEARARELGISDRVRFTGSVPYGQVPLYLALADVGVAPFQTHYHPALQAAGFYWSPLKVFEYMAMALPVVTIAIPPLDRIVRAGQEGLLVPEGDLPGLAAAMEQLLADPARATAMGKSARERVVAEYSWEKHCERLEGVLEEAIS